MVDLRAAFHAYRAEPKENPHSFHWDAGRGKLPEEGKTMILVRVQDESSTYRMFHMDPGIGGGALIGETCHWLDLVTWLMDADPVHIFATGSTRFGHIITLDFADGARACIFFGASGTFDYQGYHTISFDTPATVGPGDDFYVYLKLTNGGTYPQGFDYYSAGYTSACVAAPGESYYSFDGANWTDLNTYDTTANFSLKVFTTENGPPPVPLPPAALAGLALMSLVAMRRRQST